MELITPDLKDSFDHKLASPCRPTVQLIIKTSENNQVLNLNEITDSECEDSIWIARQRRTNTSKSILSRVRTKSSVSRLFLAKCLLNARPSNSAAVSSIFCGLHNPSNNNELDLKRKNLDTSFVTDEIPYMPSVSLNEINSIKVPVSRPFNQTITQKLSDLSQKRNGQVTSSGLMSVTGSFVQDSFHRILRLPDAACRFNLANKKDFKRKSVETSLR
ncbi:unnamed protein product [Protopolystoma xenopodis]|uniref:Uncharacterized protein n=1 Tax=Protopolystoma xenopodis TaxID=117903 RepID=A0A448WVD7_9PLAT|nr:unnamed protein product [Protopolystoma xenopodis]